MEQPQQMPLESVAAKACHRCGAPMRLVGTEPHPIYAETDLFTYTCVGCEAIEVVAIPIQTSTA